MRLLLCAVAIMSAAISARGQELSFEVAAVKRNTDVTSVQYTRILPGGRIEAKNIPLKTLVRIAFGTTGAQVVGGPDWVQSDGYDIVAKVAGDLSQAAGGPTPQIMSLLRTFLQDRFKLQVHTEMRDAQLYALVLAEKDGTLGAALKKSDVDCAAPSRPCGIRGGNGDVTYTGLAMDQIATSIAGFPVVGRRVTDRTGLPGRYDLHLEFDPAADSGPGVFTALVEQAGLKLQPEKGTLEFIVIDRAERPTQD